MRMSFTIYSGSGRRLADFHKLTLYFIHYPQRSKRKLGSKGGGCGMCITSVLYIVPQLTIDRVNYISEQWIKG